MDTAPTDLSWTRRLKLRHLQVLAALESAGTVTAAAKAMHMTQPALSHWLSDMEDLVGTPLFVRGRTLELTEAGRALWRYACRVLGDTARTGEEIEAVKGGVAGHLHIGTILSAAPVLLPRAIAALHQRAPNVQIELVEGLLEPLIERVERREVDLIIGPLDVRASRSGLCTEWLMTDSFSVVARRGHPLAQLAAPKWEDTGGYPWVLPPPGTLSRARLDQAVADAGMPPPKPAVETSSLVALLSMLQDRDYIATLASSVAHMYEQLNLIRILRMPSRLEFGPIGMLWAADSPSIVLPALRETLRDEARSLLSIAGASPAAT
ncbi:MAG: LysR substrate-binding domain-containing protein [Achromobacter sp.]|jgi:DNA-binding transcriptional LysR family regulator|uniref:LysR substrate-binding domain-containing protein n=1 Tax=unclassified Achromobacter TaxID=2626865 RepID=UPI0006F92B54|nr:LysR substrate-binding domain-containing protein [Achromobacter sp. Root565]KRA01884.1 LysR family transcriptional regulator [Achromobacter sp. Root565]